MEASKEGVCGFLATQFMGYESLEAAMQSTGCNTIDEFILYNYVGDFRTVQDLENYKESVNNNYGFYIARYEAGATTARTSGNSSDTVEKIKTAHGIPVSQEGYYPYNYVTFDQALSLAKSMYDSDEFTISLLTDSAWDRTLGWIYESGGKSISEIAENSENWGNYWGVEFEVTKGKYSNGIYSTSYEEVLGTFTKNKNGVRLLTTGATVRNSVNNIFDLAGNVGEFTNVLNYSVRRRGLWVIWDSSCF